MIFLADKKPIIVLLTDLDVKAQEKTAPKRNAVSKALLSLGSQLTTQRDLVRRCREEEAQLLHEGNVTVSTMNNSDQSGDRLLLSCKTAPLFEHEGPVYGQALQNLMLRYAKQPQREQRKEERRACVELNRLTVRERKQ